MPPSYTFSMSCSEFYLGLLDILSYTFHVFVFLNIIPDHSAPAFLLISVSISASSKAPVPVSDPEMLLKSA